MAWTSGARSVATLEDDGWFSFEVRGPIGVVAGLNYQDSSALPIDIKYGLRMANGEAAVLMQDVEQATSTFSPATPIQCFVGRVAGRLFASFRAAGTTTSVALSNGVLVPGGLFVHDRPVGALGTGSLFLDASLFASSDAVYDLDLTTFHSSGAASNAMTIGPLQAHGAGAGVNSGSAAFLPPSATGVSNNSGGGAATFQPMVVHGLGEGVNVGAASFEPMLATGHSDAFVPTLTGGRIELEPPTASGSGYSGEDRAVAILGPIVVFGSQDAYSLGRASMLPGSVSGVGWETASVGVAVSITVPGIIGGIGTPDVDIEGAALALDQALADSVSLMGDVAYASDAITSNVSAAPAVLVDGAGSTTVLSGGHLEDFTAVGTALDDATLQHDQFLDTAAIAVDAVGVSGATTTDLGDSASAADNIVMGGDAYVADTGYASDSHTAEVAVVLSEVATLTDQTYTGFLGEPAEVIGEATATDELIGNVTAAAVLTDEAWARSALAAVINNATAWVLNTESTATSWYVNWPFTAMAQGRTKTYAIGPEGLFVIGADTDAGSPIRARVEFDYTDFGGYTREGAPKPNPYVSRVDSIYVGMTYGAPLQLGVKVQGDDTAYTYTTKRGPSATPRNDRFTPGRGLRSRYWKLSLENTEGGDFAVTDIAADVATNNRRL